MDSLVAGPQRSNTRVKPRVQTKSTGTELGTLQQTTRHHHVLEEVSHLVLIGKISVKEHRSNDAEYRHRQRRQAGPVAQQKCRPLPNSKYRNNKRERGHRQTHGRDIADSRCIGSEPC